MRVVAERVHGTAERSTPRTEPAVEGPLTLSASKATMIKHLRSLDPFAAGALSVSKAASKLAEAHGLDAAAVIDRLSYLGVDTIAVIIERRRELIIEALESSANTLEAVRKLGMCGRHLLYFYCGDLGINLSEHVKKTGARSAGDNVAPAANEDLGNVLKWTREEAIAKIKVLDPFKVDLRSVSGVANALMLAEGLDNISFVAVRLGVLGIQPEPIVWERRKEVIVEALNTSQTVAEAVGKLGMKPVYLYNYCRRLKIPVREHLKKTAGAAPEAAPPEEVPQWTPEEIETMIRSVSPFGNDTWAKSLFKGFLNRVAKKNRVNPELLRLRLRQLKMDEKAISKIINEKRKELIIEALKDSTTIAEAVRKCGMRSRLSLGFYCRDFGISPSDHLKKTARATPKAAPPKEVPQWSRDEATKMIRAVQPFGSDTKPKALLKSFLDRVAKENKVNPDDLRIRVQQLGLNEDKIYVIVTERRKELIIEALKDSTTVHEAARKLGVTHGGLYYYLKELGIDACDYLKKRPKPTPPSRAAAPRAAKLAQVRSSRPATATDEEPVRRGRPLKHVTLADRKGLDQAVGRDGTDARAAAVPPHQHTRPKAGMLQLEYKEKDLPEDLGDWAKTHLEKAIRSMNPFDEGLGNARQILRVVAEKYHVDYDLLYRISYMMDTQAVLSARRKELIIEALEKSETETEAATVRLNLSGFDPVPTLRSYCQRLGVNIYEYLGKGIQKAPTSADAATSAG